MVPFISTIVPVYRSDREVLARALQSLVNVDYPMDRREILIVDNDQAPSSDLRSFITGVAPEAKYLRAPERGAHIARNFGLLRAHGDYCFFTDDDVLVEREVFRALAAALSDPAVGAAGGRVRPMWLQPPPDWLRLFEDSRFVAPHYLAALGRDAARENAEHLNLGLLSLLDLGERPVVVDENWLYSCHLMVRRDAALKAGGFGPDLVGSFLLGDNEMGILRRVAGQGFRLVYEPSSVVWHAIPARRMTLRYFAIRVRNDGTCAAYLDLREGRLRGGRQVAARSLGRVGGALFCLAQAAYERMRGRDRWRVPLVNAAMHLGYAHYCLRYLLSRRWRAMVHCPDYLGALARA